MKTPILIAACCLGLGMSPAMAAEPSLEEKVDLLAQELETLKASINKGGAKHERTHIGGYGELHYNNFSGGPSKKDEIDFHRFVLFFGHQFSDRVSLKSELEFEHVLTKTSSPGAVELEQAYLDFALSDRVNVKTGLFLIPLGTLNETHEPPVFFGSERNEIETRIIPSTWWEAGAGIHGEAAPGLNYQLYINSSLDASKFKGASKGVRDMRQSVAEAKAEDFALSGALQYTAIPGVSLGAAFFNGNTGQGNPAYGKANLLIWDAHARYKRGNLDLRALYAQGHLGDADKISVATGKVAPSRFGGWYGEAAYHVWRSGDQDLAPFVRYEAYDTHQQVPAGYSRDDSFKNSLWTVGVSYWPHPQTVLKADYQRFEKPDADKGDARVNLAVGYMF